MKTGIVLTAQGYAVIWEGVLDSSRFNDRQDAKRHLQELYTHPHMRPHKPKADTAKSEDM